mmetsp:Transcript_9460/g.16807  ORF Transcript_9460/g.16807 Transcript_9460/m.16807 type:complete len:267 (-) Transcript_9460:1058-1858(-)
MLLTSSTPKMSSLALASSASSSFFAGGGLALKACCFCCHSANCFCQLITFSVNCFEGWRCSSKVVRFVSSTHFLRCSELFAAGSQAYFTSSKPSDFSGRVKSPRLFARAVGARSPWPTFGRKTTLPSSSVSSAFGGDSPRPSSSSSFSSLISSSLISSFFSSSIFSSLAAASAAFLRSSSAFCLASASSFCFFAIVRCRSFSAFLTFHSVSSFACFWSKILSCALFLNSMEGSPMTTIAVFLKPGNLLRTSARSSLMRFAFTSMIT